MASSDNSRRNITTASSDWVNFNPYGDETDTPGNKNAKGSVTSSTSGWPLDEIINDIEHQMDRENDAIAGMTRQLEEIEVTLSVARARQSKRERPSSSSLRSSLSFKKLNNYASMRDNEEGVNIDVDRHVDSSSNDTSLRKQSILRILQRRSEFKQEHKSDDFPNNTHQDLKPPSQVRNSRCPIDRTQLSTSFVESSQHTLSKLRPSSRSSLTWDESVSSEQSVPSEDVISELEEATLYSGKFSMFAGSRKVKYILAFLATVLVLLIGILTGQWVQQQSQGNSGYQSSSLQQVQQLTDSPVTAPSIVNNIPTEAPQIMAEDKKDDNKEDIILTESTEETLSKQSDDSVEEGKHSSHAVSVEDPTMAPITATIEIAPTANVVVNKQKSNISDSSYDYTTNTDFLVGVYYYPWHGERFHNGGGYMRKELEPSHAPTLGEYNDSDPEVIGHHMKWFRQANIGLLVTSWWGPNRLEDSNTKDVIMEHEDVGNLKIALHYETTSRLGTGKDKLPNAKTDIKYMCEHYFDHPNYYKIDGRPVLFIYISRKLHFVGTLEEALLTMRSTASKCGHNLYLIGDSVFESAPDPNEPHVPFWYFDAVTNYDVYGSAGRTEGYVGTDRVNNYYQQQTEWKEQASRDECRYIPAVSPGYNDRGVRMEANHPPLSRRLTFDAQEGSLFHYQLKQAKELVDPKVDSMILVNSFNEWHEDTQIEPVMGEASSHPYNFTKGLEYEGYGELYLDILGAATSKDESRHNVFDYLFSGR
mmetsp:Transcript_3372/g.6897  ORF Transcript_3372/g.6897 Transcript_3372/m.6897 type:complete len:759 (+) Transcript_3372:141-2417(+)